MSLPAVIGRAGVASVVDLPLTDDETRALRSSAALLGGLLDEIGARDR